MGYLLATDVTTSSKIICQWQVAGDGNLVKKTASTTGSRFYAVSTINSSFSGSQDELMVLSTNDTIYLSNMASDQNQTTILWDKPNIPICHFATVTSTTLA